MIAGNQRYVRLVSDTTCPALNDLLQCYKLDLVIEPNDAEITGSFWGDSEAGIVGRTVFVRGDTPIHSLLHETCHVICMSADRREALDRDAGGGDIEESAVCYLQIVLSNYIDGLGQDQLMSDMDAWGYSFRLGSTRAWFENDADDALEYLLNHGLLNQSGAPTFRLRA